MNPTPVSALSLRLCAALEALKSVMKLLTFVLIDLEDIEDHTFHRK